MALAILLIARVLDVGPNALVARTHDIGVLNVAAILRAICEALLH